MEIKALLFDCDGLMFETESIANRIWQEARSIYHKELPNDFFRHITGSGGKEIADYLHQLHFDDIEIFVKKRHFDLDFWSYSKGLFKSQRINSFISIP
ncbi:HAD family phosphatase [Bulleidia sp. zg-1006]|uniref:HAD family phosphatase n=1 Tax=Bulleidia sp. zg-1006 TaxID=2806552 RepID=UPI00193A332E|nr:HAD family phosphatase [Bulleidia sp. zg-1006]QRG86164.1 HAD family phosphatase [Bulleidia sp. zg-1006]